MLNSIVTGIDINTLESFKTTLDTPVRTITGKVEMYEGESLIKTFSHTDNLIEFTIERVAEEKFFGFGVCQKTNIKLLDVNREITVTTANSFKLYFNDINTSPIFYVTEVNRDENTNELSITGYDIMDTFTSHTVSEMILSKPYTIEEFVRQCENVLGVSIQLPYYTDVNADNWLDIDEAFTLSFPTGANFEGTETIKDALIAVAEATQTIFYVVIDNQVVFRRLNRDGEPVLIIDKSKYFTLDSKTNRRLAKICHTTELGDNVSASLEQTGTTQYIRNNPFLDLREDVGTLLEDAIDRIGGITINQFECEWRGNPLLEIGDKIAINTKDDDAVISYVLNDVITYNGSLSQTTQWSYTDEESNEEDNPSTLGEALKFTYARVDKANKKIDLVASEVSDNTEKIAQINIDIDSINASVQEVYNTGNGVNLIKHSRHFRNFSIQNPYSIVCKPIYRPVEGVPFSTLVYDGADDSEIFEEYKGKIIIGLLETYILHIEHEITLSFEIKMENYTQGYVSAGIQKSDAYGTQKYLNLSNDITYTDLEDGWVKVVMTFNPTEFDEDGILTHCQVTFGKTEEYDGTFQIRKPKLEAGKFASEYSDAPQDLGDYVQEDRERMSSIEVTLDSIDMVVKEHTTHLEDLDDTTLTITDKIGEIEITTDSITERVTAQEQITHYLEEEDKELNTLIQTNTTKIGELEITAENINAKVEENVTQITSLHTKDGELDTKITENTTKIGELEVTTENIELSVSETNSKVTENYNDLGSKIEANTQAISSLQLNADSISASVMEVESTITSTLDGVITDVESLTKRVDATMTAEDIKFLISTEVEDGTTKVTTSTGYTFDDEGLTISKSDSEMSTQITDDGMTVYKNNEAMLVANNEGVDAQNLRATTYLIIGNNSRFEDYTYNGESRTGCFWIGN